MLLFGRGPGCSAFGTVSDSLWRELGIGRTVFVILHFISFVSGLVGKYGHLTSGGFGWEIRASYINRIQYDRTLRGGFGWEIQASYIHET